MTRYSSQVGALLRIGVIGLHAFALLGAVVVPGYAIADAVHALVDPASSESLAALVDLQRWSLLFWNTTVVCCVALVTAGILGGVAGLLATRTDLRSGRLLLGAALFGACVPVYVSTAVSCALVPAYALAGSSIACGFLYGLVYTPLAVLVLGAALRAADRELEEQALLDAGPWTVLLRVTLPAAGWGLVTLALLVVLLVGTDFTITDILTVRTFAEEAYSQYALDNRRAGPLLTALPVLLVLAALVVAVQTRYRLLGEHSPWHFGGRPRVFALGRWRGAADAICGTAIALGLGVPLLALGRHITPLKGLGKAIAGLQPALWTSAAFAVIGATLVVLPAAGLAWHTVRGARTRWATAAALVLLLSLPAPVVGISLIGLLNRPGLTGYVYDSPLIVVLGYFVRFLPIAVLLLIPAVQRVPRELELAARVDGCDWFREHWHVRIPAMLPDAALAWLVVVILCFAEVGATKLLDVPGWETAAVEAFGLLHYGVYRDLAVLALLSVAFILLPWAGLVWLLRRRLVRSRDAA